MGWFGQTLMQYPWLSLVAVLLSAVVAGFIAYDRWKTKRELRRNQEATEILTEVIQAKPEGEAIKEGISALGLEKMNVVKTVITPIKEKLVKAGKL